MLPPVAANSCQPWFGLAGWQVSGERWTGGLFVFGCSHSQWFASHRERHEPPAVIVAAFAGISPGSGAWMTKVAALGCDRKSS